MMPKMKIIINVIKTFAPKKYAIMKDATSVNKKSPNAISNTLTAWKPVLSFPKTCLY